MRTFLLVCLLMAGCTDGKMGQFHALGHGAHIKCFSGGQVIYEGDSSGIIQNEAHSDGWYWTDKATGRLIEVSGQCIFDYGK